MNVHVASKPTPLSPLGHRLHPPSGRSTQVDIDAPAVQAGKIEYCSRLNNASLDLVLDYLYVDETRSDANDLQCELPQFNGTVEVHRSGGGRREQPGHNGQQYGAGTQLWSCMRCVSWPSV